MCALCVTCMCGVYGVGVCGGGVCVSSGVDRNSRRGRGGEGLVHTELQGK